MKHSTILTALILFAVASSAQAKLLDRECHGKNPDTGRDMEVNFQVFVHENSSGANSLHLESSGPSYFLDLDSDSGDVLVFSSKQHGGAKLKMDSKGHVAVLKTPSLGKIALKCGKPQSQDLDDDSDDGSGNALIYDNDGMED